MKIIAILTMILSLSISVAQTSKNQTSANTDKSVVVDKNFQKGVEYLQKKDFKNAIEELNKYIVTNQKSGPGYFNRGLAYMYLNDFELAVHDFSVSIQLDSTFPDSYNNRGLCYYYMGDSEWAKKDYNRALKLDSKFAEAYLNRATVLISEKDYPGAIKDLTSAKNFNSKNPEIYVQRGRLYYLTNKNAESIADYTQAIKMGNKHYKLYYNRGNAYFKIKKFKEAAADYTIALKSAPEDMEILNNRSAAYHSLGNIELATKDRDELKKLKTKYFPTVDELKWKTISDPENIVFLELPENWNVKTFDNEGTKEVVISPEPVSENAEGFSVGVTIGLMKNLAEKYPIKTEGDIIEFWKGSTNESTKDMYFYAVELEKHKRLFGHTALLVKARMQATAKHLKMGMFEYIVAINDNLFYMYFQAPEEQFEYFSQIFNKAIESVRFDETNEMFKAVEEVKN